MSQLSSPAPCTATWATMRCRRPLTTATTPSSSLIYPSFSSADWDIEAGKLKDNSVSGARPSQSNHPSSLCSKVTQSKSFILSFIQSFHKRLSGLYGANVFSVLLLLLTRRASVVLLSGSKLTAPHQAWRGPGIVFRRFQRI